MEMPDNDSKNGFISAIYGTLIEVKGLDTNVKLHDLIKIPKYNIISEVIQIFSDYVVAQCFENTMWLKLNDKVIYLNESLSMELGPGLLGAVFDGIQRPLEEIFNHFKEGRLARGIVFPSLLRTKKWHFEPIKEINDDVDGGDTIGIVKETPFIDHKIQALSGISGKLIDIVDEGDYTILSEIYRLKTGNNEKSFSMLQKWPINKNRPYINKIRPYEPLITGTRIIDLLFPIAKGGTICVPGGFGTGKTVIQQTLAKYCNADIIIFIGCGEPGNEIANTLKQFNETIDPKTGRPLIEHIVVIANTSNMPVSAREASLFSGVTIGEYYRDMGYDVAVIADSTSRWAESLREISSLLEEMPAEEGYPAYLPSKISSFYERAGVVTTLGHDQLGERKIGSLTIIGTVSPPGGDFGEPVTAATKRVVQGIWSLDSSLAYLKHYPAINWLKSYSNYPEYISDWWSKRDINWPEIDFDWFECRKQVNEILSREIDLKSIEQLVGERNLPEEQKFELFLAKLIRNSFLIQNAFDKIDAYTDYKKLLGLIKAILLLYNEGKILLKRGFLIETNKEDEVINDIIKISHSIPNEDFDQIEKLKDRILNEILKSIFTLQKKKAD